MTTQAPTQYTLLEETTLVPALDNEPIALEVLEGLSLALWLYYLAQPMKVDIQLT